jgi:magnesium transporter
VEARREFTEAPGVKYRAVLLDFATKEETFLSPREALDGAKEGKKVWIDVEISDVALARTELAALAIVSPEVLDDALLQDPLTRLSRFEDCIHFVVSGCRPTGMAFDLERVDVVVGEHYVITLHRGSTLFLTGVMRAYRQDFLRFAQSLSFLVYEIWDHLVENYLSVQKLMEERVERLQAELRAEVVDDAVFAQLSELGADLLHLRKVLLPARTVLADLSTRKSLVVSPATQPYLANMVGAVEHALQDLLVDRDILTESLNLYMSLVSHRTNEVMKRLTVVSVIFLPLTFLVGVYGMNFEVLPELQWHYGYAMFWTAVVVITTGLLYTLRRHRML